MTEPSSGLLDTSVFIARETERPLGELPGRVAVSVVTIGELQLGVLNAADAASRARRADTLALARTAPLGTKPGRYRAPDAVLAFLEAL